MPDKLKKLCVFAKSGPALAIAVGMVLGIVGPTSAQFFNFGGYQQRPQRGGGWYGNDTWSGPQRYAPRWDRRQTLPPVREDFSKAPPPVKHDTIRGRQILVLGDSTADWLAYGLEDAYADQPETGVIRRHKTVSGLIKYQPKGDPADWAAAAKGILATEKPDVVVIMLGLDDRVAMREPAVDKSDGKSPDKKTDKKDAKAKPDAKPADGKPGTKPDGGTNATAKPDDWPVDTELSPEDAADNDGPPAIAPEKSTRSLNGIYSIAAAVAGNRKPTVSHGPLLWSDFVR